MNFEAILALIMGLLFSSMGIAVKSYKKEESRLVDKATSSKIIDKPKDNKNKQSVNIVLTPPSSVTSQ